MQRIFTVLVYDFGTGRGKTLIPQKCHAFTDFEVADGYAKDNTQKNIHGETFAEVIPMTIK